MNRRITAYLPVLLATAGLCASANSSHKKNSKKTEECAPLCYAGAFSECETPWEFNAAAVYQQFRVQAQEVALNTGDTFGLLTGTAAPTTIQNGALFPIGGEGVEPVEDFNWGFKVGGTYKTWYDSWKVGFSYTYLNTTTNGDLESAYGRGYNPSAYANQAVDGQTQASGTGLAAGASQKTLFAHVESGSGTIFNSLNFVLSRPTLITKDLEITPFYGIDATFLTRRQTTVFTNAKDGGYSGLQGLFYQNYQKMTWWGVGPMVGVHTSWNLAYNFSVYGDAHTSLEYGAAFTRTATASKTVNVNTTREASIEDTLYQYSPNYHFQLGVSWFKDLEEFDLKFGFQLGYETSYYSQVIKSIVPEINYRLQNGAGLGVQGVVLQANLDF